MAENLTVCVRTVGTKCKWEFYLEKVLPASMYVNIGSAKAESKDIVKSMFFRFAGGH